MGCDVDVITGKTPEELKAIIGQYDGLAIRSSTKVTKDILEAATNLKVIGRPGSASTTSIFRPLRLRASLS
jgi:D-3-phosphoglycerate dehydrogenase